MSTYSTGGKRLQVRNILGSSAYDRCGCPSWIRHYETHAGQAVGVCAVVGCGQPAVHGGHVHVEDGRFARPKHGWIIPVCQVHNPPANADVHEIEWTFQRVPAEKMAGCYSASLPPTMKTSFADIAQVHHGAKPGCGCRSWLRHWYNNSNASATQCAIKGCSNPVHRGVLVRMVDGRYKTDRFWVATVCRGCGRELRTQAYYLKTRATLVMEGDDDFCGS